MILERPLGAPLHALDTGATTLSVAVTFDGSRCDLYLAGRIDPYSLVALRAQVEQLCLEPFDDLVVHVDDLHEVDDVGLEALAGLRAMAEERNALFAVESTAGPIPHCLRPRPTAGGGPVIGG